MPASVDDLAEVLLARPTATVVAGSTDVGLWITKFMRNISPAVFIANVAGLKDVEVTPEGVSIGAGVSYDDFQSVLDAEFPHLSEYWRRIGGWQVRAMGTVGGNIANGSPIGDTPPALIALGATVTLRKGAVRRTVPLEEFFIAYGKQDREPGEFVERVVLPRPPVGALDAAYKVTKRREEDISAVACGFHVELGERQGDSRAARLRRHGGDAEASGGGRGRTGWAALGLRDRSRAEAAMAAGLPASHRLAGDGGVSWTGGGEPAAAILSESTGDAVRLVRETA